jgi:hypothetical protein
VTPSFSFAYTFDSDAQGFSLNTFVPTDGTQNLAAPDAASPPVLTWDGTVGNPANGSLKLMVSYTDYRQYVDLIVGPFPPLDLTGKTIHAKVMLTGTFTGGSASLHASSTSAYLYGGGPRTPLVAGAWTDLTFNVGAVTTAGWMASQIYQVGIQFYSGDAPEAGTFPGPQDVIFQIDSITDATGALTGPAPLSYTFATGNPGFSYNTFVPAPPQANVAGAEAGTPATLTFDSVEGNPAPGSLRASMTFTAYQQFAEIVLGPRPPVNLTGKTLHAKVRLTSGTFSGAAGAGATLRAYTTSSYVFGSGPYTTLTLGTWTDLVFDLSTATATNWNPSMVVQIGIQFYSGDPPEAGTFVGPNDVVFHIDTITD